MHQGMVYAATKQPKRGLKEIRKGLKKLEKERKKFEGKMIAIKEAFDKIRKGAIEVSAVENAFGADKVYNRIKNDCELATRFIEEIEASMDNDTDYMPSLKFPLCISKRPGSSRRKGKRAIRWHIG